MIKVEQIRASVADLSREEKAAVLEWISRDVAGAYPGITTDPAVAGGEPASCGRGSFVRTA